MVESQKTRDSHPISMGGTVKLPALSPVEGWAWPWYEFNMSLHPAL